MRIGIDFGSTYSSFATIDAESGEIELCAPIQTQSVAIPSVVCVGSNGVITGHNAQRAIQSRKKVRVFDAFKMLLTETNPALLQRRGYDSDCEYTPQSIAKQFLEDQIHSILSNYNDEMIEELVICVPEVWTTKQSAERGLLDGRNVLRRICASIPSVNPENVRVVSEPAAASAFFANYYQKRTGNQIDVHVLVIDYGGGTLDLTLTKVVGGGKDGGTMEIQVKHRTGAGENEIGKVGDAGIAYIEEVVKLQQCGDKRP